MECIGYSVIKHRSNKMTVKMVFSVRNKLHIILNDVFCGYMWVIYGVSVSVRVGTESECNVMVVADL